MMVELKVSGMTCGHCVKAVTGAIRAKDPAARVEVVLAEGLVRAETTLARAEVAAVVEEEGFKVAA
jgi:copper chaperone